MIIDIQAFKKPILNTFKIDQAEIDDILNRANNYHSYDFYKMYGIYTSGPYSQINANGDYFGNNTSYTFTQNTGWQIVDEVVDKQASYFYDVPWSI